MMDSRWNKVCEYTKCVGGALVLVLVVMGIPFLFGMAISDPNMDIGSLVALGAFVLAEICFLYVIFLNDILDM